MTSQVRSLHDGNAASLKMAGPSVPVEITGWDKMPMVGDLVLEVPSEQRGREVIAYRTRIARCLFSNRNVPVEDAIEISRCCWG
jgi:translation initiation factor IF-2